MPDVRWEVVEEWFDPETNGTVPDLTVPDTTVAGWQAVVDLVRANGWAYEYREDNRVQRIPDSAQYMFDRAADAGVVLKVWPSRGILVNFFLWSTEEITFDISVRDIHGQAELDVVCRLMRAIGRKLRKPVFLSPEGSTAVHYLTYSVALDRVETTG